MLKPIHEAHIRGQVIYFHAECLNTFVIEETSEPSEYKLST